MVVMWCSPGALDQPTFSMQGSITDITYLNKTTTNKSNLTGYSGTDTMIRTKKSCSVAAPDSLSPSPWYLMNSDPDFKFFKDPNVAINLSLFQYCIIIFMRPPPRKNIQLFIKWKFIIFSFCWTIYFFLDPDPLNQLNLDLLQFQIYNTILV